MKICHLASGDLWAGAEVQLFHLTKKLSKLQGVDLLVILLNHGQLEEQLIANGIKVEIVDESKLSSLIIFKKLFSLVKKYNPDIIHTHRNKENVIGSLVALFKMKKSVRTVHGVSEFVASPFGIRRFIADGLDKILGLYFQKKIIAVSVEMHDDLSKSFPERKVAIIENSVDIDYIEARSKESCDIPVEPNAFNIAFVGRFASVKRPDIFYEVAESILKSDIGNEFHFHMIGDGPLFAEIQKKITENNLNSNFHLHGFIENSAPVLSQMNLLMFTSDDEGLPMTLLEAMSLNIPVLSRNLPSIHSVLCDGDCGYVLDSDAIENYVQKIQFIFNNQSDAKIKSDAAKRKIMENYNMDINTEKYINLYHSVIGAN